MGDRHAFLGKFCFTNLEDQSAAMLGTAELELTTHDASFFQGRSLNIFVDSKWDLVRDDATLSCADFLAHAALNEPLARKAQGLTFSFTEHFKEKQRPHFWYVTVSNCAPGEKGGAAVPAKVVGEQVSFDYRLHFTNSGNSWDKEFSSDEQGLVAVYTAFLCLYVIAGALHARAMRKWWELEQFFHPVLKMVTGGLALGLLSSLLQVVDFATYTFNGRGVAILSIGAHYVSMIQQVFLTAVLLVMAQGWTISTPRLRWKRPISGALIFLTCAYEALLVYYYAVRDPASNLYIYESLPGLIIVLARLACLAAFLAFTFLTFRDEYDVIKRDFYLRLGAAGTVWFLYLPIIVLIAALLDPWVRFKTISALYKLMNFSLLALLAHLLAPWRARRYFRMQGPNLDDVNLFHGDGL